MLGVMGLHKDLCRRWFGAMVLAAAVAMLIAGETVLADRLRGGSYLIYWLLCFCFTGLAGVAALLDFHALRQRAREQKRALLETALKDIEMKARERSRVKPSEKEPRIKNRN